MEMNEKNIEKLFEFWIGSEMLIPKTLKRPKNLLGSVEHHKRSLIKASKKFLRTHSVQ